MSSQSPVRGTLFAHIRHRVVKPSRARPHNGIALPLAIFLFFGVLSPATLARAETASGWGIPVPIEPTPPDSYGPRVAVTPDGAAIAVWHQLSPSGWTVAGSRYVIGYGWTAPLVVGQPYAIDLKLAADPRGDAIAVWTNLNEGPSTTSIRAIRYAAGGGWEDEQLIAINGSVPDVALDASGNATAVWIQWDGTQYDAFASRFAPGTGWGTATRISIGHSIPESPPKVAVGADGRAIVAWTQDITSRLALITNRFVPGVGWGLTRQIDAELGNSWRPSVAVDAQGNGIVVRQQPGLA